jgi:hypothetical protein
VAVGVAVGLAVGVTVGVGVGVGVAVDRKSQPHDSQNRPVRGAEHTGHGSPDPAPAAAVASDDADGAGADVAGACWETGGAPMRAPHSSQ